MNKLTIVIFLGLVCGCANTDANLQRESARTIGRGLTPDQIVIADANRGITNVSWVAKTPKGMFKCFADDMLRRVNCVK
jgi:hypothetical protein